MPLHFDSRRHFIALLAKKAEFLEKYVAEREAREAEREAEREAAKWAENDKLAVYHWQVYAQWKAEVKRAQQAVETERRKAKTIAALKRFMDEWQPPTPPAEGPSFEPVRGPKRYKLAKSYKGIA